MKTLKKIMTAIGASLFLFSGAAFAENFATEEEGYEPPAVLFKEGEVYFSGYGGPVVRFGSLNNSLMVLTGGKGGMIINDSIVLGGGGYGMVWPDLYNTNGRPASLGYGGFLMEYIFFPKNLINFSIGTIIGAGSHQDATFFVLEPEVNLFVNVTEFLKIGLSAAYRYTNGLNSAAVNDNSFGGFSGGIVFEFGKF